MDKKKVIIIAIDGGNYEVINEFMEKGLMPNLKSFKNTKELRSVMPPATAVAWASFTTGTHPGKNEIYDFTILDEHTWDVNFINRERLQGKTLWEYFDEANVKGCFLNIPLTYPVDQTKGIIVSGIETPSTLYNYTYPREIKKELDDIGYRIDVSGIKSDKDEIVQEALYNFEKRMQASDLLLAKDPDFFIVLFRVSDIVMHYAWGKPVVEEVYLKIDNYIGKLKEKYPDREIIIMSDHGFEKIEKAFNTNAWLQNEGYLKTNFKKSWLQTFGITRKRIYWIIDHLHLNFLVKMVPRKLGQSIPDEKTFFEEAIQRNIIDFTKTKALSKRALKSSQIFLNKEVRGGIVKPEDEEALKQEIKQKLIDYFKDKNINVIVKTKEEWYGEGVHYAPDVTIYFEEKGWDTHDFFSPDKEVFVERNKKEDAQHNMHGIIYTNLDLNLDNPCIVDLAPTLLNYFGVDYSQNNFDGKSLISK
jgi:predicted AlkP superfamily phosphohydrolase/phosphomutase